jgi:hypothetical protein
MDAEFPDLKFHVEAAVAVAKAAALITSSEFHVAQKQYASAAVETYYALFHTTLGLLWLIPDSMPENLRRSMVQTRDSGRELPDKQISHKMLDRILSDSRFDLPVATLTSSFRQAIELREFASYGPRIIYKAEQPFVGPCHFKPRDVRWVVSQASKAFLESFHGVWNKSKDFGYVGSIIVDNARTQLTDSQFPFHDWFAENVILRAIELVNALVASTNNAQLGAAPDAPDRRAGEL